MDMRDILDGLLIYLCFIPVLTFHEYAHAWVAWKCGDDTAKNLGRVSLNPLVHMELVGTVILPLAAIYLSVSGSILAGFIIGWGKPVPVDVSNLRQPRRDDTLIALAGPGMNFILAFLCMGIAKVGFMLKGADGSQAGQLMIEIGLLLVRVNLILAFFNLLPIPPLDGSHVVKNAIGMSYETYWKMSQYGLILVIVAINIPGVREFIWRATRTTELLLLKAYGG